MKDFNARLEAILTQTRQYYDKKISVYGPTYKGVDWNSKKSQELRFEQLLKICNTSRFFSINDYGCGYGALAGYLMEQRRFQFAYNGYDISVRMIEKAKEIFGGFEHCTFIYKEKSLKSSDYTIASGIFNVKLEASLYDWRAYVFDTIKKIAALSNKGFAFNMLTKYSDPKLMREDLFYEDPLLIFDYCKKKFSRFVALLHDYPLYEFTILVRKANE